MNSNEGLRRRATTGLLYLLAVVVYFQWLTATPFGHELIGRPAGGQGLGLTFNSMLANLLQGRFDVDPATVGTEGFERDGLVYAYWGILFALLRAPLLLWPQGLGLDVTCLSCLVAVSLGAFVKVKTLRLVFRQAPRSGAVDLLYWILLVTVLFAGPQIQFLKSSLYVEVCLWASTLGAAFVYCAIRGLLAERFSIALLSSMAAFAGLALMARVSMGVGLYAATALLLLSMLFLPLASGQRSGESSMPLPAWHALVRPAILLPAAVLLSFAVLTGFVNFERWGDPLVFADYQAYIMNAEHPDRLPRTAEYGLFNLSRIPFGLVYFLMPVWVLLRNDGRLVLEEHQLRLIDSTELPPSSFLLTDALPAALLLFGIWSLARTGPWAAAQRARAALVGAGLGASCLLMLCAISMCHRYRLDFYPFIEYGAFVGLVFLLQRREPLSGVLKWSAATMSALSIGASQLTLVMYKLSDYGPGVGWLDRGFAGYYWHQIVMAFPSLARFSPT